MGADNPLTDLKCVWGRTNHTRGLLIRSEMTMRGHMTECGQAPSPAVFRWGEKEMVPLVHTIGACSHTISIPP
jgi:hypothetical protein